MAAPKTYDALVLGAGPAGLAAALNLARVSRTCAVLNSGAFRNAGVEAAHGVLGLDHVAPEHIRALGRGQMARYGTATFVDDADVVSVEKKGTEEGGAGKRQVFVARDRGGREWVGRTVVLAMGVGDVLPALEGYAENWPANIYQCLFCDGWERRALPKGVLCFPAFSAFAAQTASMAHHLDPQRGEDGWSKVTVFANGEPNPGGDEELATELRTVVANGIRVDARKVVKLVDAAPARQGVYVHLRDGDGAEEAVYVGFLAHTPPTRLNGVALLEQLGVDRMDGMFGEKVKVDGLFQGTSVPGVFVVGDAGTVFTNVANAMLTGSVAAGGVAHFLNEWDDEVALEEAADGAVKANQS